MNTTATTRRNAVRTIVISAALGIALGCAATVAGAAEPATDAVRCVQKQLNALGFEAGSVDGLVGVKTFLASEAYVRYMRAKGEDGLARMAFNVRRAHEWCEMVANDFPTVAPYWYALQDSEMPADREAIFNLAYGYDSSAEGGGKKDDVLAARLYLRAAALGYAPAQRNVGGMFGSGRGVPLNSDTARYWFAAAANQGDAQAQYVLGKFYTADSQVSLAWLWKAAKQGHKEAIAELELRLHI
jgi:TPR repeat protein